MHRVTERYNNIGAGRGSRETDMAAIVRRERDFSVTVHKVYSACRVISELRATNYSVARIGGQTGDDPAAADAVVVVCSDQSALGTAEEKKLVISAAHAVVHSEARGELETVCTFGAVSSTDHFRKVLDEAIERYTRDHCQVNNGMDAKLYSSDWYRELTDDYIEQKIGATAYGPANSRAEAAAFSAHSRQSADDEDSEHGFSSGEGDFCCDREAEVANTCQCVFYMDWRAEYYKRVLQFRQLNERFSAGC